MSTNTSNEANVHVNQLMGSTRVLFSPKEGGNSDQHAAAMVKAAGDRVQIREGGPNSHVSVQLGGEIGLPSESGAITSARSQSGMPRHGGAITPDSLINLDGMQVRVRDAVAAGAVVQNPDGSYKLAGSAGLGKR